MAIENNPWYTNTMRLEAAGFKQEMLMGPDSTLEDLQEFNQRIDELREKGIPFETIPVFPSKVSYALYVKTESKFQE